ncbi:MAG: histidine triad nucleotide-binding protein [Faecalibacterium sp.]
MDCLFCKMSAGDIPVQKVYEDDQMLVFYDIEPQAPVHVLAIPKKHISSAAALAPEDAALIGHMYLVMANVATDLGCENGYRIVTNIGEDGGQSVKHLHFHLLGKRSLAWPPG